MEKQINIQVPNGYEIDKEKSTFETIIFKEIKDEYPKVISFRNINSKKLVELHANGKYCCKESSDYVGKGEITLESELACPDLEIYQVAKSKNEIFTVGDKVSATDNYYWREGIYTGDIVSGKWDKEFYNCPIRKFKIINEGILCIFDVPDAPSYGQLVQYILKAKNPLFITEDVVEIYDLDHPIYVVNVSDDYHLLSTSQTLRNTSSEWKHLKIFSTKEAAEKWIDENKPMFSKKQILDTINEIKILPNSYPIDTEYEVIDYTYFKQKFNL